MPQMSDILGECAIGMLTAGMSTRAVNRTFYVNFSTINCFQRRFREQYIQPTTQPQTTCIHVGERFANVNGVNKVPHGAGGVVEWAGVTDVKWLAS